MTDDETKKTNAAQTTASRIAKDVRDQLWNIFRPAVEYSLAIYCRIPFKADKKGGKTKEQVTYEAHLELLAAAYKAGLDQGYDMGMNVFGGPAPMVMEGDVSAEQMKRLKHATGECGHAKSKTRSLVDGLPSFPGAKK
jgi:hypothetical protein